MSGNVFQSVAFVNHKGGVGKSLMSGNAGFGLFDAGKKVSLLDLDTNGSLSKRVAVRQEVGFQTPICHKMTATSPALRDKGVFNIDNYIKDRAQIDEFLIIDTPGQSHEATMEVLISESLDLIIIPMQFNAEEFDVMLETIINIDKQVIPFNPNVKVAIIQTRVHPNSSKADRAEFKNEVGSLGDSGLLDNWDSHFYVMDAYTTYRKSYSEMGRFGTYPIDHKNANSRKDGTAAHEFKTFFEEIVGEQFVVAK